MVGANASWSSTETTTDGSQVGTASTSNAPNFSYTQTGNSTFTT